MAYKQKHKPLSKPRELPKREHRHYWPYLPAFILTIGLVASFFLGGIRATHVLGTADGITSDGLLESSNTARSQADVAGLTLNAKLARAAQQKATDMAKRNYWSHDTPEGKTPWTFVDKQGYSYQVVGENLAYGFSENQEIINGWLNSPSHRDNLLSRGFTDVGFGVASSEDYQGNGPETVVVAMYAKPGKTTGGTSAVLGDNYTSKGMGVTRLEAIAGQSGQVTVILFASLIIFTTLFLLVRHVALLKTLFKEGEAFVLHHPILDVTLVALCILGAFLAQTSGFIR
ncbi:CAP domain-containing protein [Candidatus Saccharibacteria bacterium]|nr:CAP domain-containing protein [Candidatus Saccharibacteria bacterium]